MRLKPIVPVLDPLQSAAPDLWRGCSFAIFPGHGRGFQDYVTGAEPTATPPALTATTRGPASQIGASWITYAANANVQPLGADDFSFLTVMRSTYPGGNYGLFSFGAFAEIGWMHFYRAQGVSPKDHVVAFRNSTSAHFPLISSVADDCVGPRMYLLTRKGSSYTFYVGGHEGKLTTWTMTYAPDLGTTARTMYVGASSGPAEGRGDALGGFGIWKGRALTEADAHRLFADPFAMFRPRQPRWWAMGEVAAAGGLSIPVAIASYHRRRAS